MEKPVDVQCPWCGENFLVFFDTSGGSQTYIEDCGVCCRPVELAFAIASDGSVTWTNTRG